MSNEELIDVAGRHMDLAAADKGLQDTTVDGLEPVSLDEDPFDDDLEDKLQARAPLPITKLTVGLASLVLVVAGFLGGVLVACATGINFLFEKRSFMHFLINAGYDMVGFCIMGVVLSLL